MDEIVARILAPAGNDLPIVYKDVDYKNKEGWEVYFKELTDEYDQCVGEGLDVEPLKPAFDAVRALEETPFKALAADRLFTEIQKLKIRPDYPYTEPSDIEGIRAARPALNTKKQPDKAVLPDKIKGAWYGRICGCLAGKTVEGIRTEELIPFLKASGNYPMHRYILSTDLPEDVETRYKYNFKCVCYADRVNTAPVDDDTNYTCLYQELIKACGRNFTPEQVCNIWLSRQPKSAYCTAERVAICNMIKQLRPPYTATFENPYREWIGAQIRADYFGYINPGDPETAADMAWRDACISHVKNGIYGEMFVAAMLAEAAVEDDIEKIIEAGLNEIPAKCRLQAEVRGILDMYHAGKSQQEVFDHIHTLYDEHTGYGWCHTNSNAMIVCAALLYGKGDYGTSICMAIQTGFDTDCNGATVGSILGMRSGASIVGPEWTDPIHGFLRTTIIGVGDVSIDSLIETTLHHIG